jgi:ATP-dependent DNA ligase
VKLLAAVEQQGLEGIVCKLTYQPYRSSKNPGWIKVKTATWREANRDIAANCAKTYIVNCAT